ncbi:hypothetical protein J437_LFUL002325 [Ladona fulva]|uniref:Uncharacterized protein n=1 Tax=Ladona fulva TaxID=123851 RepID=A0A8K0K8G1_LADFU|nr:hypothetical protein J437_LFUL002325 [Ladona fulva]
MILMPGNADYFDEMEVTAEETKWKLYVPSPYWDAITCHYLKDGSTVYVCTKDGMFLECRNGVIEKSLMLAYENANCITHFLTYHPYAEYFIVKEGERLAIIINGKDLSIFQQHTDVKKHEIRDFTLEGYPQIKIWPNRDGEDPFIVDFSTKMGTTIGDNLPQVQISPEDHNSEEAKTLIASYIHKLAHKKRLRSETIARALSDFKIILYKGKKENFCYSLKRISSKDIQEVNKRLELKYQALPPKPIAVWYEETLDEKLSPGKGFFLITKFAFPDFVTKPSLTVQGKLSYSFINKEGKPEIFHQDYPTFYITAQNVVNGSVITESPHESFFQCLSSIAVSKAGVVTVNTKMSGVKSVEDILVKSIGFTPIGEDNLFLFNGNGSNALFRSVIQAVEVSDTILQLHLYPRLVEFLDFIKIF